MRRKIITVLAYNLNWLKIKPTYLGFNTNISSTASI